MATDAISYYISSGSKNKLYTLRCKWVEKAYLDGEVYDKEHDNYVKSLGNNLDEAIAKAKEYTKLDDILVVADELGTITKGTVNHYEMPNGKFQHADFRTLDDAYILWWFKQYHNSKSYEKTIKLMQVYLLEKNYIQVFETGCIYLVDRFLNPYTEIPIYKLAEFYNSKLSYDPDFLAPYSTNWLSIGMFVPTFSTDNNEDFYSLVNIFRGMLKNHLMTNGYVEYEKNGNIELVKQAFAEKKGAETYFGKVGDKFKDIKVNVKNTTTYDSQYGVVFVYIFEDEEGHTFVYKGKYLEDKEMYEKYNGSSEYWSEFNVSKGDTLSLSGTVKAHTMYGDTKQTLIIRPTVKKS